VECVYGSDCDTTVAQKLRPVAEEGDEDGEAERMVSMVQIVTPQ
jgi:hypothetical protein